MTRATPTRIWWPADALAASGLPAMPGTKQGVNALAIRDGWRNRPDCARRKAGRGGGWEYHWSVLPDSTRAALLTLEAAPTAQPIGRGDAWSQFDTLPEAVKATAKSRLDALQKVQMIQAAGATKMAAVSAVATDDGVSSRAVFGWFALVDGIAPEDWLAYLAPKHRTTARTTAQAPAATAFMTYLKGLYLRLEGPSFRQCYRDALKLAEAEGSPTLKERTAQRRLEVEVPWVTRVFLREGEAGLIKCFPPQTRDLSSLTALEAVNADCHKIDIFVQWPDGTVDRPQIVAFQDIYSRKLLSWRVDHNPNKVMVMAAFGELIETWGIPRRCLFDNGREFANKWLTAGAKTRFRFKVREDDPLGVLPLLDINIHWATPAHGQAKPIERGFRDLASDLAKDPRFAGAYVGNCPDAKPENYKSRAVPIDTFLQVTQERIDEHNARDGRLTQTAEGRSFDATFAESYAKSPIRKATEAQRRLWMMGQHVGKLHQTHGSLMFQKNVYHSDWMSQIPGRKVIARFDPEDLHSGVHIYSPEGEYLGFAECQQKVGFFDLTGAKIEARRRADIKKAERDLAKALRPVGIDEIAAKLDAQSQPVPADIRSKVVEITRPKHRAAKPAASQIDPQVSRERDAMIIALNQPASKPKPVEQSAPRSSREKFFWARDVLDRSERGEPIGTEEARRVRAYTETPQYQSDLELFNTYGATAIR